MQFCVFFHEFKAFQIRFAKYRVLQNEANSNITRLYTRVYVMDLGLSYKQLNILNFP